MTRYLFCLCFSLLINSCLSYAEVVEKDQCGFNLTNFDEYSGKLFGDDGNANDALLVTKQHHPSLGIATVLPQKQCLCTSLYIPSTHPIRGPPPPIV